MPCPFSNHFDSDLRDLGVECDRSLRHAGDGFHSLGNRVHLIHPLLDGRVFCVVTCCVYSVFVAIVIAISKARIRFLIGSISILLFWTLENWN